MEKGRVCDGFYEGLYAFQRVCCFCLDLGFCIQGDSWLALSLCVFVLPLILTAWLCLLLFVGRVGFLLFRFPLMRTALMG